MIRLDTADRPTRERVAALEARRCPRPLGERYLTRDIDRANGQVFALHGTWNGRLVGYLACRPRPTRRQAVVARIDSLRAETPEAAHMLVEFASTFPAFAAARGWYYAVGEDEPVPYLNMLKEAGFLAVRLLPRKFGRYTDGILFAYAPHQHIHATIRPDLRPPPPRPAARRGGVEAPA